MFRPPKIIDPKTPVTKMTEENQNIQVFVRCRPLNSSEKRSSIELIPERKTIKYSHQNRQYTFDNVFDAKSKQFDVYQSVVEPLVDQATEGYNCTVFAYGQTGTGKTYTMIGKRSDMEVAWDEDPTSGIIPRAIDQLIDALHNQQTEFTIRVSYLELYNEDAYDLLSPLSDTNKLRIYNDAERKGSVIISGLVELIVNTKAEIFEILEKGSLKRQTAPTLMNACSSRSHSIFSITVHIKETTPEGEEVVKMGKLNLVDLAGSENIGRSGAVEERAREASNINKSLLTLGRVITSLVEKSPHIPYRDSKLTRLLQDSLGGKTKTSIIATISPGTEDIEDTLSTLDYAQRAKKITNKPEVNLKMSKKTLISEYVVEIEKLRRDLEAARDKKGVYVDAKNYASMEATLKEQELNLEVKETQIDQLQREVTKWNQLLLKTTENLTSKCEEFDVLKGHFAQLANDLTATKDSLAQTKIEIEEQKVLVDSHQATEHKLFNQAQTILKVTDKCVDDNQILFKKIDKIGSLEEKNTQLLQTFNNDLSSQLEQIQQMNVNVSETIQEYYQNIEGVLSEKKETIANKNGQLYSSLMKVEGTVNEFESQFFELLQQDLSINEVADNLKLIFTGFKSSLSAGIEASLASCIESEQKSSDILDCLTKDCLKSRESLESKIMCEISRLDEFKRQLTSRVKSIQEDVALNYKSKCQQLENALNEIAQLKSINENNEFEKTFEDMAQMCSSMLQMYKQKKSGIRQYAANIEQQFGQQKSKEESTTKFLAIKGDELQASIEKGTTQVRNVLCGLDQEDNRNCQNILDKCAAAKDIQAQFEGQFQESAQCLLTEIESAATSVSEKVDTGIKEALLRSIDAKTKHVATFKETSIELVNVNIEVCSALVSMVAETGESALDKYKEMQLYCGALHASEEHMIQDGLKMGKNCVTNFDKYQKTGMTPQKSTFTYPRTLACTSPHERIIARYRAGIRENLENNAELSSGHSSLANVSEEKDSQSSDSESISDENVPTKQQTVDQTFVVAPSKLNGHAIQPKFRKKYLKERN